MTPDQAIKTLEEIRLEVFAAKDTRQITAIKLGEEALKAIQRFHRDGLISSLWKLPGETRD